ncbi:MAG: hybrid sensor histidine kinase/response regulator, partial [Planctomycetota bacterium]
KEGVDTLLKNVVDLMPNGWQYTRDACARITCDEGVFESSGFRETPWKQSTELCVGEKAEGVVEVFYLKEKPEESEGPFLTEERELLENLARQIGLAIETRRTRIELQNALEELRDAQRRVVEQERQRALTTMASGIAHDFNNALSTIQGFTDLLLQPENALDDRETIERYLKHVRKAARNAAQTVRRLRKFYRPAEKENLRPVDLNALVEETVSMTKPLWKEQARAEGAEVLVETNLGDIPPVEGNEAEFHEMLTNLIFNAVDAMPEGGTLSFRTREEDGAVILEVGDTGMGMSSEVSEQCFDPFYTTKKEGGTGLGLSTVQGTVRRYGGQISVESEVGEGTTFHIVLPASDGDERQKADGRCGERVLRSLRVLLVDDNVQQRELISEYLRMDDHVTDVAENGREGLKRFRKDAHDLVITDRSMPEMGGDDFASEIKAISPETPVVMLTGFGDIMTAAGEVPENVDMILAKPVNREKLKKAIFAMMSENKKG